MPVVTFTRQKPWIGDTTLELPQIKQAFWTEVMHGVHDHRDGGWTRLVGLCNNLMDSRGDELSSDLKIWVPESVDEDFNLVLSLCSDGQTRPCLDIDETTATFSSAAWKAVPSTEHIHGYMNSPVPFHEFQAEANRVNPKWAKHVSDHGYATLRPPWISKYEHDAGDVVLVRGAGNVDNYWGFLPYSFAITEPPVPAGTAWDDLGWDE